MSPSDMYPLETLSKFSSIDTSEDEDDDTEGDKLEAAAAAAAAAP